MHSYCTVPTWAACTMDSPLPSRWETTDGVVVQNATGNHALHDKMYYAICAYPWGRHISRASEHAYLLGRLEGGADFDVIIFQLFSWLVTSIAKSGSPSPLSPYSPDKYVREGAEWKISFQTSCFGIPDVRPAFNSRTAGYKQFSWMWDKKSGIKW